MFNYYYLAQFICTINLSFTVTDIYTITATGSTEEEAKISVAKTVSDRIAELEKQYNCKNVKLTNLTKL